MNTYSDFAILQPQTRRDMHPLELMFPSVTPGTRMHSRGLGTSLTAHGHKHSPRTMDNASQSILKTPVRY